MPKIHSKGQTRRHPRRRTWLWTTATVLALAAGVWVARSQARQSPDRAEQMEYAPVQGELTLPISVQTAASSVREIYEFAARRPDVLHYLPCFCGCWRAGHKSNYDCFVDAVKADGVVDIDEMGFT